VEQKRARCECLAPRCSVHHSHFRVFMGSILVRRVTVKQCMTRDFPTSCVRGSLCAHLPFRGPNQSGESTFGAPAGARGRPGRIPQTRTERETQHLDGLQGGRLGVTPWGFHGGASSLHAVATDLERVTCTVGPSAVLVDSVLLAVARRTGVEAAACYAPNVAAGSGAVERRSGTKLRGESARVGR